MAVPRFLLRLIDPASAWMDARFPRPSHGPVRRSATVFGPGLPEGGRPPTPTERQDLERIAAEHAADHDAAVAEVQRRWSAELAAAAEELVARGAASLRLDECAVEARVVRFWRGDALLEVTARSESWSSESRTRIPRDPRRLDRDVFVHYLANTVARS